MLSILISAYACSPNMGSEPGMAWNWCINLARHCELHIITEGEFRDKIEAVLPTLPQSKNIHFYYNPVSDDIRRMCWNQGDWRFYKHYRKWQYKTYEMALEIIRNNQIDIVHQLNMIGFREPGYLWRISDKPFIWGPVDAKERFPTAYLEGASAKSKAFIRLKNFLTHIQLQYSGRLKKTVRKASFVISASSESQKSFIKYFRIDSPLLNETGCYPKTTEITDRSNKETLDLLWVGKLDFRKQLTLAIGTLSKLNNKKIRLHIVGGGDPSVYQELANSSLVADQCIWHGSISHNEVQRIMQESDIFFFTSVAEGTPHVVLEAISNNLPVICFDTCGQGDSVDNKVGIKISLSNPKQSILEFVEIINDLFQHRNRLKELSHNCAQRQLELSWENKALQMIELYKKAMKQ